MRFGRGGAGMKAIKLYAWEDPYLKRIQAIRDAELVEVKRMAIMSIFNSVIFLGGTLSHHLCVRTW
jgi:hypothetical protein